MRFLITGAAGFVGSNLASRIAKSGDSVLGIDNFSSYYSPSLKELRVNQFLIPNGVKMKRIDLVDLAEFRSIVKDFNPDTIIHLAAQPGVRTPLGKSYQYIQNNVTAFSNVLQTTIEFEVPKFLYASSSSVYGNSKNIPYREDDTSIRPISIYGATKLANEILAPAFVNGSKTRARGMRFFTVYGPWGRPDMAYFRIIDSILNGTNFQKFGSGEVKRDFTFVDDITLMVENLARELSSHPDGYSDVVNIGGGNPYSLNDLIRVISNQLESNPNIIEKNSNPNDTSFTCADVSSLQKLTGGAPMVDLESGVRETIAWARESGISDSLNAWVKSTN